MLCKIISREIIFELEKLKHSEGWGGALDLQGVTGKIRASQMKFIKEFIAK